jgi:hypothetical protein
VEESGSVPRQVLCEQCGKEYYYIFKCSVVGTGFSTLYAENEAAQVEAATVARKKLEEQLARGCDTVPCPGCLHYQKDMVAYARRTRWRWMTIVGLLLLLATFALIVLTVSGIYEQRSEPVVSRERTRTVLWTLSALTTLAGAGLIVVRFFVCRRYDPNQEPLAIRKDRARRRALTRDQLENMVRNQQRKKR